MFAALRSIGGKFHIPNLAMSYCLHKINCERQGGFAASFVLGRAMRKVRRFAAIGAMAALLVLALGANSGSAEPKGQPKAHVYLLRGLMNIFSLGMDSLGEELQKRGVYATVHNHSEWQQLAQSAAAAYRAGNESPIILIGHSLGADSVMAMADYLDHNGVPVALVVPFDGTQSFAAPKNVSRLLNLTQRDYAYMKAGVGFHGTLSNVDLSGDPSISHTTIDKSPRLHARVIAEVLAVVGNRKGTPSPTGEPPAAAPPAGARSASHPPAGVEGEPTAAVPAVRAKPVADGMPVIAAPERTPVIALPERTPIIAAPERTPTIASPARTQSVAAPERAPVAAASERAPVAAAPEHRAAPVPHPDLPD